MLDWIWDWFGEFFAEMWAWVDALHNALGDAWNWVASIDIWSPIRWLWSYIGATLGEWFGYLFSGEWMYQFIAWAVERLLELWPTGFDFIENHVSSIIDALTWAFGVAGWLGYVVDLPAFLIITPIILACEVIVLIVRIWRFILSLIPVA